MLSSLSVGKRIFAIVLLTTICSALFAVISIERFRTNAFALRELHLADVVATAQSVVGSYHARALSGELSEEEAKHEAARMIEEMRFDGSNYFFVTDANLDVVAHGGNPDRRGRNMRDYTDPNGVFTFRELDAAALAGGGLVRYASKRNISDSSDPDAAVEVPKLSYALNFEPWGWRIAAGSYIDDIEAVIRRETLIALEIFAAGLAATLVLSLLIARSVTRPIQALQARMKALRDGDLDNDIPSITARDEIGGMARSVGEFRENARRIEALAREKTEADARADAQRSRMMASLADSFGTIARQAALGDFTARISAEFEEPVLRDIARDLNNVLRSVEEGLAESNRVLRALASGDLTERMTGQFAGDFAQLQDSLNTSVMKLNELLSGILNTSEILQSGTRDISGGIAELSARTEQQAASLEETSATMDEMSRSIRSNSESARDARDTADQASERARRGGEVVSQAMSAMAGIEEEARRIEEIVAVIDGLAFQTNLLALNAAVEAARAGEAGKGFSVVASEVRSLAERSSHAARDIRELISQSTAQVGAGSSFVRQTGAALDEIVEVIGDVARKVGEISRLSSEQSTGVDEIAQAINHLDQITQQNSAMADQSAGAARHLADQGGDLARMVSVFRTGTPQTLPAHAA